ncbi:hypothetical protein ACFQ0B_25655 [Nonomuraea thailandensis]
MAFAASGRAPFGGDTLPSIVYQVLNSEPNLDAVEPGLRELVAAALRKDPATRPTAQQLLDHLVGRAAAPEQAAHTVQVAWQTTPYTSSSPAVAGRRPRRGRLYGALAAAVAVLVAGGVAAWAVLVPGGPPDDMGVLYREDFTQTSGGWNGVYDPEDTTSQGYRADGTYGLDAEWDDGLDERWAKAPVPFLTSTPTGTPDPSATPTPMLPSSVVIAVTANVTKTVGSGEYGIYCHNFDEDDYYEFGLDTKGSARIRRIVDGAGGTLAQPVQVSDLRGKARLVAACEQSGATVRLRMWVNDELVQDVEDPNGIGNGSLGLFARTPEDGRSLLKTTFDDFELRGNKEP